MNVEYINPFVAATTKVFRAMLGLELRRQSLTSKCNRQPYHEVSGIIDLYGMHQGIVVLGISRATAIHATEVLLGQRHEAVNEMVCDAVGELTNIVAGNAKAALERLKLHIGLPRVVVGRHHTLPLIEGSLPFDIVFSSDWDQVVVEVSLLEQRVPERLLA